MVMFPRIVSKLSLSPSAVSELTFYARRLKQESVTRTFSAVAAVLVVLLQFSVISAPPTPSNAASSNDIIHGGFTSKNDLLNQWDSSAELRNIYGYWGITRQDIVNAKKTQINSTDHALMSVGRNQFASNDTKLNISGHTYWARHLYEFDTGNNKQTGSYYDVLQGYSSKYNLYFSIMFHCGNPVFKSYPPKPAPPPPPKPTPTPPPPPKTTALACVYLSADTTTGTIPLKVKFTGQGYASGQTIVDYLFDNGDGTIDNKTTGSNSHTYSKAGTFIAHLQVKGSQGKTTDKSNVCSATIVAGTPPANFTKSKSALNLTQNIDATTKPSQAGDQIKYTLATKNIGGTSAAYAVVEHLEDVLEYADVTDNGGGTLTDGVMTWPESNLLPGATLTKSFTVTVKNPIPATPVGLSNHMSYDLHMDNVYGNGVDVAIQPPLPKQVEAASSNLPDTGAPVGTIIVLVICGLSLFFYLRNRQLIAEIKLLRGDYQGGV
jgi:PKD repeat protein